MHPLQIDPALSTFDDADVRVFKARGAERRAW
jgi:hypothetical protein